MFPFMTFVGLSAKGEGSYCAEGALRFFRLFLMTNHAMIPPIKATPTTAAMTPPTMAPVLDLEPPLVDEPDVEEGTEAAVDEAPEGAEDSPAPELAIALASVALKLSGVCTSRYAHAGTDVPDGMSLG